VTGFEPFGGAKANPSQRLVEDLLKKSFQKKFSKIGIDLKAHVLEVEYTKAFNQLKDYIEEYKPEAVFTFGVAQKRKKICFERVAINYRSTSHKDNSGEAPKKSKIIQDGPDGVFSNIADLDEVSQKLNKKGWEVEVSLSAGDYVCNALMYEASLYSKEKRYLYDFIHIPADKHYERLHKKDKPLPYFVVDLVKMLLKNK
jgi:pyroglutamyl-peptidase